jgi:3-oxoadipate enol-lactonase
VAYAENAGCRLYYEDYAAAIAVDDATPLVFVPGLGLTAAAWSGIAARAVATCRVIALDPRGAGRSDKPDVEYTGELFADDVAAVLDAARIEQADVVGLSMGGMIVQELAIRHPGRVRSLVLASTYAATDEWSRRVFEVRRTMIRELGIAEQFKLSILLITSPATFREYPEVVSLLERALTGDPPDERAYLRQLQYCMDHDTRDRLHEIRAPTLVINGANDILTSPFQGYELAASIPGAQYCELANGSHVLVFEEPDEFLDTVLEFVARTLRSGVGGAQRQPGRVTARASRRRPRASRP